MNLFVNIGTLCLQISLLIRNTQIQEITMFTSQSSVLFINYTYVLYTLIK